MPEIRIDDILKHQTFPTDTSAIDARVSGKVILVTGAAGSLGSELCRQILKFRPAKLLCLDQSETGLFFLQLELSSSAVELCLGDYTQRELLSRLFSEHGIQGIFQAAAYKHLSLMEAHPRAALHNNVFGLMQLLDVAEAAGAETFVLLSSDKAVRPANIMGATKRIGELILAARPVSRMRCMSVRFGNVLGSQGSVVPIFLRQLSEHKPLTVTHPEASRFFMTVEEAASLILQASTIGSQGDTLVLEMGEPLRILDLARNMIRLAGKSESEVEIVFTGLRPGEKLHEDLLHSYENPLPTSHPKIKRAFGATAVDWEMIQSELDDLRTTMHYISDREVREAIRRIVPEYYVASISAEKESALDASKYLPASAHD